MKQRLLVVFGAGLLAGCAPTLAPHSPYMPLTREKGQAEARVATGLGGTELLVGYQVTNGLVLHGGLLSTRRVVTGKGFRSADLGFGYYYFSPNGIWRLGMHAGMAAGRGTSGSSSCFECGFGGASSEYILRYTYGYVQPTIMLEGERRTWGLALRLGQTYYQQLNEKRTEFMTNQPQFLSHAGHTSTFVQPMLQSSYRLLPWLVFSSKIGIQTFLGVRRPLNNMNPLVAQASLHFVVRAQPEPKPRP